MYCQSCGTKSISGAQFCIRCGERLTDETAAALELPLENSAGMQSGAAKSQKKAGAWLWLLPLFTILLTSTGVWYYYQYETGKNLEVSQLHRLAGDQALAGKYIEALAALEQAILLRPAHASLEEDRQLVQKAIELDRKMAQTDEYLKTNHLVEAETALEQLTEQLNERPEPLFVQMKSALRTKNVMLSVLQVKQELDQMNTVSELAAKLREIGKLEGAEAEELSKQIIGKIANISYQDAEQLLKDKQFSDALAAIDVGLRYAKGDERLLSFQNRVKAEREAFERAEQERIELAMQKAAEEDLQNRTAAVQVSQMEVTLSEYGDIILTGEVSNVATKTIYSITIEYSVYDMEGERLGSSSTTVDPYVLDPGTSGVFSAYHYGYYQNVSVRIDNITWYLD